MDTSSLSLFDRAHVYFFVAAGGSLHPAAPSPPTNGLKDISSRRGRRHTVMNE